MALEWFLLVPDDGDRTQTFPGAGGGVKDGRKVALVVGSHSGMLVTVYLQQRRQQSLELEVLP